MSAEREAFKALEEYRELAEQVAKCREKINAAVCAAIKEFFDDHPYVEELNTYTPMTVVFANDVVVNADELEKLSKCLRALETNLAPLRSVVDLAVRLVRE